MLAKGKLLGLFILSGIGGQCLELGQELTLLCEQLFHLTEGGHLSSCADILDAIVTVLLHCKLLLAILQELLSLLLLCISQFLAKLAQFKMSLEPLILIFVVHEVGKELPIATCIC